MGGRSTPAGDAAAAPGARRVVLLTPGGKLADAVVDALGRRGIAVPPVVLYRKAAGDWRRARTLAGRVRALARTPLAWARGRSAQRRHARALAQAGASVTCTGTLADPRTERDLRAAAPDVVVLAFCDLVSPRLLAVPREATVNVHPGLLPWIRGNGPIPNSLLRDVPLGSTAFRVDAGIDTGAILSRRLLPVRGGETLSQLRDALFGLWVEMTVDVVEAAWSAPLPAGDPHPARFPLCRVVTSPAELAAVDAAVAEGRPKALFDRWAAACDPTGWTLPAGAEPGVAPGAGR
jgi:folate-dependent phosphoribosylglycinamide formyltransferase PurN